MTKFDEISQKLVEAAKREDWEFVDSVIPEYVGGKRGQRASKRAYLDFLNDSDPNIRDLGMGVIEKSKIPKHVFGLMRDKIAEHMINDAHPYVRFRASFALAAHGSGKYKRVVLETMKKAKKDPDVREIAMGYEKNLKN